MQRFLVVRASIKNREAISFALDQLLAAPAPTRRLNEVKRTDLRGLGPSADVFLGEVRAAIEANESLRLEQITAQALRESGVDVVVERPGPERGVDLAIWSDVLQPFVGNPLLVEIKVCIRTQDDGKRAFLHLSSAMTSSGTRWGLFLYGEGPVDEDKLWASAPPNVLVLSLPSLFERMRLQPFADVVKDLRNRRVHGGNP